LLAVGIVPCCWQEAVPVCSLSSRLQRRRRQPWRRHRRRSAQGPRQSLSQPGCAASN